MMSVPKSAFTAFFCLLFSFILSFCSGRGSILCPEIEKQALLTFKQSLRNFTSRLSTWNSEIDCCEWNGVFCNNLTGHVLELNLGNYKLNGKLHSSLLNLKYLTYLDLSDNQFYETIPSFVGSFTSLKYLDLSYSGFYGAVPRTIGNLSKLHALSLASSPFGVLLNVDNFEWLSSLSQLETLNMKSVNLSGATNWVRVITTLPSLAELSLRQCNLDSIIPLNCINITTSLTFLDLSHNYWSRSSVVPSWVFQIPNLVSLNLSWNMFEGPIPTIGNNTLLQKIDLSINNFNSFIPNWFYLCKDLEFVRLEGNNLQNNISNEINNLTSLKTLNLNSNNLSGSIPDSFGNLSRLESLDLSHNKLFGAIPSSLGELSSLRYLDLADNNLMENLPKSLGQLLNLKYFSFGENFLEGVVTETYFANLTNLEDIVASKNHLTLKVRQNWIPPFNLKTLKLGSWNIGISIPSWMQTQKSITELDLSNTRISGTVPDWVWKVNYLDLSYNQLHGTIPNVIPSQAHPDYHNQTYATMPYIIPAESHPSSYYRVHLNSNKFNGSLPRVATNVVALDLSNNSFSGDLSHFLCDMTNASYEMRVLHVGNNGLSGALPDCWVYWRSLRVLHLENNSLSGAIPCSMGFLSNLLSLNLYNNRISGRIPLSMLKCTSLVRIDLSRNDLEGNIPIGMGTSISHLSMLILSSNRLSGELSSDICHLNSLHVLDLSNNKFSGRIPNCVGNFTAMATGSVSPFQYSQNPYVGLFESRKNPYVGLFESRENPFVFTGVNRAFTESIIVSTKGREWQYGTLHFYVTSIDLSNNSFSGDIPKELMNLGELKSVDLSENRFEGSIPDNIGNMRQLESLDLSGNSLSGNIPSSMAVLSFLSHLNLSYNNLTGRIPESTQLRGFDPSRFMGNHLCGHPWTNNCSNDHDRVPRSAQKERNVRYHIFEVEWLYVFMSLGYATGLSAVCSVLVLKKSWREALFGFVEDVWDEICIYLYIKWRRLVRRWG